MFNANLRAKLSLGGLKLDIVHLRTLYLGRPVLSTVYSHSLVAKVKTHFLLLVQ